MDSKTEKIEHFVVVTTVVMLSVYPKNSSVYPKKIRFGSLLSDVDRYVKVLERVGTSIVIYLVFLKKCF